MMPKSRKNPGRNGRSAYSDLLPRTRETVKKLSVKTGRPLRQVINELVAAGLVVAMEAAQEEKEPSCTTPGYTFSVPPSGVPVMDRVPGAARLPDATWEAKGDLSLDVAHNTPARLPVE